MWFTRVPQSEPLVKTGTYERGAYFIFDPTGWETVRKVCTLSKSLNKAILYSVVFYGPFAGIWRVRYDPSGSICYGEANGCLHICPLLLSGLLVGCF